MEIATICGTHCSTCGGIEKRKIKSRLGIFVVEVREHLFISSSALPGSGRASRKNNNKFTDFNYLNPKQSVAQLTEVAAFTVHFICSKPVRIISDWFCLITNHGVNPL